MGHVMCNKFNMRQANTHTITFFHNHHHEIPLHWANSSYHLSLGIGSLNSSIAHSTGLNQSTISRLCSKHLPNLQKPLVVVLPSFLLLICAMPFVLLGLEGLKMQSRSPKHSKMWRTVPSPLRQFTATWRKLVWRLWWSKNALSLPTIIGGQGWTLLWAIRIGLLRTGSMLYGQMRWN